MSVRLRYLVLAVVLVLLVVMGSTWYSLSRMQMSTLAICAEGEGGIRIPQDVCYTYLKFFRLDPEDIEALEKDGGLEVVLNGTTERKYDIAELLIKNGLGVDVPNRYSKNHLTPLQSAVLYGDFERVKFLVEHGASIRGGNPNTGHSALQMAHQAFEDSPTPKNREILGYLELAAETRAGQADS